MGFEIDPAQVEQSLPECFPLYGLSMTLPYLEPYLIRTMRSALEQATDDFVIKEVKQFIGQEAQHYKQHKVLNDMLLAISPEMSKMRALEEKMDADYQRFTNTKSLRFNLAYAEGFEAATMVFARHAMESDAFDRLESIKDSDILRLFKWHMMEEVEHRNVCFDIYQHLFGNYFYRVIVGGFGQLHFFRYMFLFSKHIAENCPQALAQGESMPASKNFEGGFWEKLKVFSMVLKSYTPWYTPRNYFISSKFKKYSEEFSSQAKEIRAD
jgi:predicted metal-dependent hydrolase